MKSKYLVFAMLVGVTLSTVACSNCQTCTMANATDVEICKKDYANVKAAYDLAITQQETAGYTCN